MKSDLGDILWYVAALASEFKLTLDDVATYNLEKLRKRMEAGTLTLQH
jgi:NTP pyrophosphatase (non-canonical NTP hydrolase)